PVDAYRRALLQAEEAHQLEPQNGIYLNTLGVAQYRVGQYRKALDSLQQADTLFSPRDEGGFSYNLAFLAMTHYRLGNQAKAQAVLARLQETMREAQLANNKGAQAAMREAKELIEGRAPDPKK